MFACGTSVELRFSSGEVPSEEPAPGRRPGGGCRGLGDTAAETPVATVGARKTAA
jgi:hypothetical protein